KAFSDSPIDLTVQSINGQRTNIARGAVTALIKATPTFDSKGRLQDSVVNTIDLRGDGGSIDTSLWVSQGITSTGPLGDLNFDSQQGLTNVMAHDIFGSITTQGPITGTIQTTGQRLDPITGLVANLRIDPISGVQTPVTSGPGSADIGRLYL